MCPTGVRFIYMNCIQMKEAKNYFEQVQLLKNKGIIIKDNKKAEEFLSEVNYYKISGYYLPYIDKQTEKVKTKITFDKIVSIYKFDRELSSLILKIISEIEIYLRTSIAYYHGHKYGAIGYENPNNFRRNHDHERLLNDVLNYAQRNGKNPVIIHHNEMYGGHYPIWVIVEFFEMGTLSAFYRDLQNEDKTAIARNLYNANYKKLQSWFSCLNQLRNRCCHFSRMFYSIYPIIPMQDSLDNHEIDSKLFTQILVLKKLYPNKTKWFFNFVWPLLKLIFKYSMYNDLKYMGFSPDWFRKLIKGK